MNKVPILLYHDLCSETDKTRNNFAVTWGRFKEQMEYLHQRGFVGVSLAKFMTDRLTADEAARKGLPADSRRPVILTFDDGDVSNYHFALPVLKEKGFSATFFVTIDEIGKKDRMDWPTIYDLGRQGMDVGSHGLTHTFLTAASSYALLNDLLASKQVLEKYMRRRVDFLSVPQGFYNKHVLQIARDVGFKAVCVSDAGYNDFSTEIFLLKRFTMRRHYGLKAFVSIVTGKPQVLVGGLENVRATLRRVLGYQVYDRMRRFYRREKKREDASEVK